jgi:hypothetical protein
MDIPILPEQIVGYASMVYPVLTCFVLQKMTTTLFLYLGRPITWISILIWVALLHESLFWSGSPYYMNLYSDFCVVLFAHSFNLHGILYSVMH